MSISVRHALLQDKAIIQVLDTHIDEIVLVRKIKRDECYVICDENNTPVGVLRYSMFWDNIPFCNLLYIAEAARGKGLGTMLLTEWESAMRILGYKQVFTSTLSSEDAQHFYRKNGYTDCGCLLLPGEPLELIMRKDIQ